MKPLKILSLLLLLPFAASAQFYIGPGSTFFAPAGTVLTFDSLVLIPSADLALSNVTITKSYTPIGGSGGGGSVSRIYSINAPFSMQGIVGMYVAASELNGNIFPTLQIAYDPGAGFITTTNSVVDVTAGYVADSFSAPVTLSQITATGTGVQLSVEEMRSSGEVPGLSLFPNPAAGVVYAELSQNPPGSAWLTVTDVSGKVLMRLPFDQPKIAMDVSRLAAGIYFATYSDGKRIVNMRLSKL